MPATERWARIKELFEAAVELAPDERTALLENQCGEDIALRREVESLLESDAKCGEFIEEPVAAIPRDLLAAAAEEESFAGRQFGAYRVIREIGRGGLGAVYLAARSDEEYRKEVAIKVVKRGLDTDDILRRFRAERQILAQLDHPNIARLIDAGSTDEGLPYFVMEYVDGLPISTYCDTHRLPTIERLTLFRTVCRAVTYAHQHLVIHRDIKPSNILVTKDGTPKLLDFGIAKVLHADDPLAAQTLTGVRVMTPEYASPEQVRGLPISTATDIYSLGVLLYELLTGEKPYRITTRTADEISRAVVDQIPDRPSTRVTRATNARSAGIDPRSLRGDLDNIVLMALRKEPQRRYASVEQFSEDIRRHLEGRPVIAHKDSVGYRAGKFMQRNRVVVAAAAMVFLSLIGGMVTAGWQARRATEQARLAAQERDRARVEATKAARINAFLQHVLGFSGAHWNSPNPQKKIVATIAEALEEASRRAERELADQPEILAAVQFSLSQSYAAQGKLDVAVQHLRASWENRLKVLGPEHPDTAQSITALAEQLVNQGKYSEAESLSRQAVAIYRRARERGSVDPKWFSLSLNSLGIALISRGDAPAGEGALLEAVEAGANLVGEDRGAIASIYGNLGISRGNQGDIDAAVAYLQKSIEELRRLPGEASINVAIAFGNLGSFLTIKGEYARAEPPLHESLDIYRKTVGEKHQFTAWSINYLADNYCEQGNYPRALEEAHRALAIQREVLEDGHIDFARSWTVLGKILTRRGELADGEEHLRNALALRVKALKPGHWRLSETQGVLGECLAAQNRFDEAETLLLESHTAMDKAMGANDPRVQRAKARLVKLYEAWAKPELAAKYRAL